MSTPPLLPAEVLEFTWSLVYRFYLWDVALIAARRKEGGNNIYGICPFRPCLYDQPNGRSSASTTHLSCVKMFN